MYGLDYLDWVTLCGNTSLTRYLVVGDLSSRKQY